MELVSIGNSASSHVLRNMIDPGGRLVKMMRSACHLVLYHASRPSAFELCILSDFTSVAANHRNGLVMHLEGAKSICSAFTTAVARSYFIALELT